MASLLGRGLRDLVTSVIKAAALAPISEPPEPYMAKSALSITSMRKPSLSRVMLTWSLIFSNCLLSDSFCLISFSSLSKFSLSCFWPGEPVPPP